MDLLTQKQWFDSPAFQAEFHYNGPLGAFCRADGTEFSLWAPTAQAVTLFLYHAGDGGTHFDAIPMTKGERGVWRYTSDRDLDGVYYDYEVTADAVTRRTADPYARACGANGLRSMVLDLRRTDPEGWERDVPPAPAEETIIYELHVKDFSHDPAGGFPEEERGRYRALCRTGTTLNGDGLHPTGLDHIKKLGVTHIQLMPVYDYGSVDEAGDDSQYNWGYDPANYNVPEGSYSSDPYLGEVRIRELKEVVQALHRNGLRVIMDVVYNHTYALDSWLWRTVPWYYYRQNNDSSASNGSGCGNELASERSMCAQYILDSVLYWAEEYHMDGFRFDLMGLLDVDLMNRIQAALDERFGAGEKLIYGEPWSAASSAVRDGTVLCTKDHLRELSPRIGAFCDNTRDAVKGGLMNESSAGFVNGGGMSPYPLLKCMTGWAAGDQACVQAPSQTITYLSCHDDWTLWDKLMFTLAPKDDFRALPEAVLRANRLAAAINFSCQGFPFLLAGEEFARTKGGVKNSYRSAPGINQLDWTRAVQARPLCDYYRGLIALRKRLPCLQDKTADASRRILSVCEHAPNCVSVVMDNSGADNWQQVLFLFHAGEESVSVQLPEGSWQILADEDTSFHWEITQTVRDFVRVPGVSALILGKL